MGNNLLNPNNLAKRFHPGETLSEKIQELGMDIKEFAIRSNKPQNTIHAIIRGDSSITLEMATAFEKVTHIPASFWVNKQRAYDEYVIREKESQKRKMDYEWAKKFPYQKMCELGWLPSATKIEDKLQNLLMFFRMGSMEAWETYYMGEKLKVAFRMSLSSYKSPCAVSAWLRQGEILSEGITTKGIYSSELLKSKIPLIKEILYRSPNDYASQLQDVCSYCGIKLIYIRHLAQAPINGCVRWINGSPCIFLSDKQKRYDVFCFSLFHEIGHILLHGKKDIFLEDEITNMNKKEKEIEADKFASDILLKEEDVENIKAKHDYSELGIYRTATEYNVHPSVIVGRLLFLEELKYPIHYKLLKKVDLFTN